MGDRKRIETTKDDYHDMAVALDKCRENSRLITVERAAFARMFRDHAKLCEISRGFIEGDL